MIIMIMSPTLFKCTTTKHTPILHFFLFLSSICTRTHWWLWCYCMPGIITSLLTNTYVDFISVWPCEFGDSCLGLGSSWSQRLRQGLAFRIFIFGGMKERREKPVQGLVTRHWGSVLPGTLWGTVWNEPQNCLSKGQMRGEFIYCLSFPVGQGLLPGVNFLPLPAIYVIRIAGL